MKRFIKSIKSMAPRGGASFTAAPAAGKHCPKNTRDLIDLIDFIDFINFTNPVNLNLKQI